MVYEKYYDRWLMFLLIAGGIVLVVFFFIFQPLSRRAEGLDSDLHQVWKDLLSHSQYGTNYQALAEFHQEAMRATEAMLQTRAGLEQRFALSPALQKTLAAPFLNVDFVAQRFEVASEFSRLAYENSVKVDPSVEASLPVNSSDLEDPSMLWAQLEFARNILYQAVVNRVAHIHSMRLLPVRPYRFDPAAGSPDWQEFPVRIRIDGSVDSIMRFLACLVLDREAIEAAGLPNPLPGKPEMMLDQLILERAGTEPEQIHADLLISCFLWRELSLMPPTP